MPSNAGIRERIQEVFAEVVSNTTQVEAPELSDDSVLLETGLDSLGFAVLVARLDEELGYDPFSTAEEPFYPRLFGEFVEFYVSQAPKP